MQGDLRPESSGTVKNAAETAVRSLLDKPLSELTEEDIAQLTREDCRRFLKEKGMRRPSWNKSQAIQQVISLKALLEGRPEFGDAPVGAGYRQKAPPPRPAALPSPQEADGDSMTPPKEPSPSPSPYRRRDPIPPVFDPGEPSCRFPVAGRDQQPLETPSPSPRVTADVPAGQLTIFYDGKVNVYNDVAVDKARAILTLAASRDCYGAAALPGPLHSPQPARAGSSPAFLAPGPGPVPSAPRLTQVFPTSPAGRLPHRFRETEWRAARETEPEGPTNRKASLQRYLEKRKDRLKGRRTLGGASSSSMEMICLSQKFGVQIPNEQLSRSNASSPTQPRPPGTPTRCSSIENQTQKNHISIDLNDDGSGN
ncbi:protein TIFY 4B-like isoform X2 [Elaeis guineensis]|uniref:protein TIFY 4B-like isoform X2 n=1 Tax=Elaeis guineensis var. tenera TaxID=51953 RepID=UPI00057B06E7